jgi:hypothetical protein
VCVKANVFFIFVISLLNFGTIYSLGNNNDNETAFHYYYYCPESVWSQNSIENFRQEEIINIDIHKKELLPDRLFSLDV